MNFLKTWTRAEVATAELKALDSSFTYVSYQVQKVVNLTFTSEEFLSQFVCRPYELAAGTT